jgi:hypothetical protein
MIRRRALLAYLIGAAVAGTFLVIPYTLRAIGTAIEPASMNISVPIFLLPIAWGTWNCLYVVRRPRLDIGAWGGVLGVTLGIVLNGFYAAQGVWFGAMVVVPVAAGGIYFLGWYLVVGPLNEALGADDGTP